MDESQVDVFTPSLAALLPEDPAEAEASRPLTCQERRAILREMADLVALLHSAA